MNQVKNSLIAGFCLSLAACSGPDIEAPQFALDQCYRLPLVDASTGKAVLGAEDLVWDQAHNRIFIAAYDRRATEKAAKKKTDDHPPSGGIYTITIDQLFEPVSDALKLTPLAFPHEFSGGLRPHGMTYDAANRELIFINRTYAKDGRKWRMTPKLQRLGANGEVFVGVASEAPCSANNVVAADGEIFTSFDHASCGWQGGIENLFNLASSGIAIGTEHVFKKARFANGIAVTDTGDVALAATREQALLLLSRTENGTIAEAGRIEVPGGPDNLTKASDGGIVAALHPNMFKLALNRKLGLGRAPSRIVKADPDTGNVAILFDDPDGSKYSAATVAISLPQGLVLGSVTDSGLLICREGA
ncbi:hypothetical protein ABFZ85_03920 [Hyphococcus formosus]|uniref:hypothetical protein n=1 Tax=Hyphococcus formosus TaxID=3143534 RepID=UPI00398BA8F0